MRTLFIVLVAASLIVSCSPKKTEKVATHTTLGLFTPYRFFPETLNGQVKEVKEVNYWAVEKDGVIDAGEKITPEEYDSIQWTHNFIAQFAPSGNLTHTIFPDEKEGIIYTWNIVFEGDTAVGAEFMKADTLTTSVKMAPIEGGGLHMMTYNEPADTLAYQLKISYTADHQFNSLQWSNFKSEPTYFSQYSYDDAKKLTGFTGERDDTLRSEMKFTYNEQGFAATQEVINYIKGKNTFNNYEYTYDDQGNWIKCIAYEDSKPHIVVKRDYVYYE